MVWIQLAALLVLGMIVWEDLRERSIHWWWLPLLAIGLALPRWNGLPNEDHVWQVTFNLIFLALQVGGTFLFLLLRNRAWINPVDRFIGLGDLLFFAVLALGFSSAHFMLFLLSGLALCIPAYLLLVRLWPSTARTVPTAGFLAAYLFLWKAMDLAGMPPVALTASVAQHLLAHE